MGVHCRLKVIFAEREIRQGEFAEKLGISQTTISNLVRNNSLPELITALRIARELDLQVEDIWELRE